MSALMASFFLGILIIVATAGDLDADFVILICLLFGTIYGVPGAIIWCLIYRYAFSGKVKFIGHIISGILSAVILNIVLLVLSFMNLIDTLFLGVSYWCIALASVISIIIYKVFYSAK